MSDTLPLLLSFLLRYILQRYLNWISDRFLGFVINLISYFQLRISVTTQPVIFKNLHSVRWFEVRSSFIWCIMTCVCRPFWFSSGSGLNWKNDSQLGSINLAELTKFDFCVFDLGSIFWWLRMVILAWPYAQICIRIFLKGFDFIWQKLAICV